MLLIVTNSVGQRIVGQFRKPQQVRQSALIMQLIAQKVQGAITTVTASVYSKE